MRILGIDPGLQRTGFGVIEAEGARLAYVASGTISTTEAPRGDLPLRLKIIFEGVREVVQRYTPDCATVEIVFVNVNPQSTLLLGQARGAAMAALVAADLAVAEYTALQMKKAVVGHGLANKSQVQEMVRRLLALPGAAGQGRCRRAGAGDLARPRRGVVCRHRTHDHARAAPACAVPQGPQLLNRTPQAPAPGAARRSWCAASPSGAAAPSRPPASAGGVRRAQPWRVNCLHSRRRGHRNAVSPGLCSGVRMWQSSLQCLSTTATGEGATDEQ